MINRILNIRNNEGSRVYFVGYTLGYPSAIVFSMARYYLRIQPQVNEHDKEKTLIIF